MRSSRSGARRGPLLALLGTTVALASSCVEVAAQEQVKGGDPQAVCGDGVRDPSEACDEGAANSDESGTCTTRCMNAGCGDGMVRPPERCDLGAANSNTGDCTLDCQEPSCGDGFVQGDEECDLGSGNGGTDCSATQEADGGCRIRRCGNGQLDPGEACDEQVANSQRSAVCTLGCQLPACGDGARSPKEDCDEDAPGCTDRCSAPTCGVSAVALGMHQTYARMRDGRLIAAGNDEEGQLGREPFGSLGGVPVELEGRPLWRIAAGGGSGAGITFDGRLLTWGANGWGQLGLGDLLPHPGRSEPLPGVRFLDVSAGWDHFLALDDSGTAWSWGRDDRGQVGDGLFSPVEGCCAPTPVKLLEGQHTVGVFAGNHQSFILRADGALYAFGQDDKSQLGDWPDPCQPGWFVAQSPLLVPGVPLIREVAAAADSTFLLDVDGVLWVAGLSWSAHGVATTLCQFVELPAPLQGGEPIRFVSIAAGEFQLLALDDQGGVWGLGSNNEGQLGLGAAAPGFQLTPIPLPAGAGPAIAVQAAWRHSAVLLANGELLVSGWNNYGMLGQDPAVPGVTSFTPFPACP